jgi:hypothetical protein
MYDAVNGIRRTHETYLVVSAVPTSASLTAAASAAGHRVPVALYPVSAMAFDSLYAASLTLIPDGPQKSMGLVWGESVAEKVLRQRANDGSSLTISPPTGTGPGYWVSTPPAFGDYLLPQWGLVAPFCMNNSTQFRPSGPPSLMSPKYATDFNEIKALGAAVGSRRTLDQTQIALFWAAGVATETPPGHWNSIAQEVSAAIGNSVEEKARLFASFESGYGRCRDLRLGCEVHVRFLATCNRNSERRPG